MAIRIIGGSARSRRLASPPGSGFRPTGDKVREALFNILGQSLDGWRFLDICAGSGAVSLEALSRGAHKVVGLELDAARCRHIRDEAIRMNLAEGLDVRCGDALDELSRIRNGRESFHAAYLDPPWAEEALRQKLLDALFASPPLCQIAAVEFPALGSPPETPEGARMIRRADYGRTSLMFFEPVNGDSNAGKFFWTPSLPEERIV